MKNTETTSSNNSVTAKQVDVDHKALEIAGIDLISQLENLLATAVDMDREDFIDDSADIANKMIDRLDRFSAEFFQGDAPEQCRLENERVRSFSRNYEQVLKTRPLSKSIIRTFWNIEELPQIQAVHKQLGESLLRACATTFSNAVALIGIDNEFGREFDKSSVVFVDELRQSWK